ncbi:nucleotidyltransferase domain-containing protein [Haloarchaeobius amylolyticus]|uniref:nucleotidyltransferase domain-containing protein n=1 Tax=Haloarchaeobius amylolyticus TaxID=1198296 RepID=UPI00226D4E32|nr:nucleotidyltransferase domain-containing protein [Haloarchaeobius amylolyticus]
MAKQNRSDDGPSRSNEAAAIQLPVPALNPELFRHKATNDILRLLLDNPYETFTIRELSRLTDHSTYSIKSAVDVLEDNDLVTAESEGNRRPVGINRTRVSKPDDPVLRVPQPEFHVPIRTALDRLQAELDDVRGVLVFGSVARGQADRQSDIDLWVLVADSRGEQHRANEIATELGQERFDGERYEFQVMVESIESAQGYADRLTDIFTDAITLHESEALRKLKKDVLSNA